MITLTPRTQISTSTGEVEVDVEAQGGAKALHDRDRAGLSARLPHGLALLVEEFLDERATQRGEHIRAHRAWLRRCGTVRPANVAGRPPRAATTTPGTPR